MKIYCLDIFLVFLHFHKYFYETLGCYNANFYLVGLYLFWSWRLRANSPPPNIRPTRTELKQYIQVIQKLEAKRVGIKRLLEARGE